MVRMFGVVCSYVLVRLLDYKSVLFMALFHNWFPFQLQALLSDARNETESVRRQVLDTNIRNAASTTNRQQIIVHKFIYSYMVTAKKYYLGKYQCSILNYWVDLWRFLTIQIWSILFIHRHVFKYFVVVISKFCCSWCSSKTMSDH